MAAYLKPDKFLIAPPGSVLVDPSHPLASQLRLCLLFNNKAGPVIDILTGRPFTVAAGNYGVNIDGDCLRGTSGVYLSRASDPRAQYIRDWTATVVVKGVVRSGEQNELFRMRGTSDTLGMGCGTKNNNSTSAFFKIRKTWAGSSFDTVSAYDITGNRMYGWSVNGTNGFSFYTNGVLRESVAVASVESTSDANMNTIVSGSGMDEINLAYMYGEPKTSGFMSELNVNPYGFLVRPVNRTYYHVAATDAGGEPPPSDTSIPKHLFMPRVI
jgi:hypothetical protein